VLNGGFPALPRGAGRPSRKVVDLPRWRVIGLVAGVIAAVLMVVVGCTSVTTGTAVVNAKDAPAYRTSVSVSLSESAVTSSARESKRQESLTVAAVHNSCDALSTSSVDAITAVNAYVNAFNGGGGEAAAKEGPAADSLNHSADLVSGSLSSALSPQLHDALNGWVDSARAVAKAIRDHNPADQFNSAIDKLNSAKTNALTLCDAAY
jgi:hypothetical protein